MKTLNKKNAVCLLLMAILASSSIQALAEGEMETSANEVLDFLNEVVMLDMSEYEATLTIHSTVYPESMGGLAQTTGKYTLVSNGSKIDVAYKLVNNVFCYCALYPIEGAPKYSQAPSANIQEAAGSFIEKYGIFKNDSATSEMKNALSLIDASKNSTGIYGSTKLEYSVAPNFMSFQWRKVINGAAFTGVSLTYKDGVFYGFSDDRSYYKIGGSAVNLSEEAATKLALEQVQSFTYNYNGQTLANLKIVEDLVRASLAVKSKDKPLELYPFWKITLPLADVYPGFVTMLVVEIWADTSEVIRVYPLGTGGGLESGGSPSPEPSASPQPSASPATSPTADVPASASPVYSPSPTTTPFSSQEPTSAASPSYTPQMTASPLLQPADNAGGGSADFGLWLVVGFAVVVVGVLFVFVVKRRRG